MLDLNQTMTTVALLSALIGLGTTIWNLLMSGSRANSKRIDALELSTTNLKADLEKLEQTVSAMPGKDEIHQVRLTLVEMAGKMDVISAHMSGQKDVMKRLETIVTRHEEHLLGGSK